MAAKTYETADVTPQELDEVVAGYNVDNPTNVQKIKQTDGNWTVRATFDESDDD